MKLYKIYDYSSKDFPIAVWPVWKAGSNRLHRHDCFEMAFVTQGSGLCRINDLPYPVLRGDVYVMNPADTHSYEMEANCRFYNILFKRNLFAKDKLLSRLFDEWESKSGKKLYQLENEDIETADRIFATVTDELRQRKTAYEIAIRSLFANFLVKLIRLGDRENNVRVESSFHQEASSRVFDYINRNLGSVMTVDELAGIARMSASAFCRAFRKWTGNSVMDYAGNLRISKARQMLEQKDFSIGEIAGCLGYYDSCHFAHIFRRKTGLSPRQYRKLKSGIGR